MIEIRTTCPWGGVYLGGSGARESLLFKGDALVGRRCFSNSVEGGGEISERD